MTKGGIAALITSVGGAIALVAAAVPLWGEFGWMPRSAVASEIERIEAQAASDAKEILEAINENHTEWKCDELSEELLDALTDQATGFDSVELQHKIERIKTKMDDMNCSRFDDFD